MVRALSQAGGTRGRGPDLFAERDSGILQTEEYARAIFLAWDPRVSEDILRGLVRTRRDRKAVFTQGSGPALWSIIHEAALHTEVGDREVMGRALTHLREAAERPNITVQILPFTAGAPAVLEPFILLRQPDGHRTLFGDTVLGGQMSESPDRVGLLLQAYERLRGEALGSRESLALVSRKLDEFHGRMA
ncbi:DUF5753 domain-containing protein [Streptomyces sp. DSM 44915]|uniref:DUF5753 domain-containing protein n=1 Tax=Streptomyces chisholmiae TaxID=3075540 RepID=A0ABU2JT09_9ACTN|nr:DUF5753 domain-containing protein [Streptomyces sp. DSM 44915]MDT0268125.1 DUF5753 domain-containing protein [Streptomyces sp. DSM 44915]